MTNIVLLNREVLEKHNYIRKAKPDTMYWFDFSQSKLENYVKEHGHDFNLIIAGAETEPADFYVIPFDAVSQVLTADFLATDEDGRRRWIGHIQHQRLEIRGCPTRVAVGEYYGNPSLLSEAAAPGEGTQAGEEDDYAIENCKQEINARRKQSLFRKRVLSNFGGKCCLSGLSEDDLLEASHIVPWSKNTETRLDPANGLCLSMLYHPLFDCGYFSFDNQRCVIVTSVKATLSTPLTQILGSIDGCKMSEPEEVQIDLEYLKYHREHSFKTGTATTEAN